MKRKLSVVPIINIITFAADPELVFLNKLFDGLAQLLHLIGYLLAEPNSSLHELGLLVVLALPHRLCSLKSVL